MSAEGSALIDTNVLLYAADKKAERHEPSRRLRDAGAAGEIALSVTAQILLEYVSVITSPKRVATPSSVEDAWTDVEQFASVFSVLEPPGDLVARAIALGRELGIRGPHVFDLAIAVTMLGAGVSTVYTYDSGVFARVEGITAREP